MSGGGDVASALTGSKAAQTKLILQGSCFMGALIFFLCMMLLGVSMDNQGVETADATELNEVIQGDTEFWITHYDPALGGINGRDCGGAVLDVCSDSSSPTGYVGKFGGKVVSNGVIAVPQNDEDVTVPLLHSKRVLQQAKIIIPGYNNSEPTMVGDHFATSITKGNRLDLACSKVQWAKVSKYLQTNKLILDSKSGYNGGSKVMGKVVGNVIR